MKRYLFGYIFILIAVVLLALLYVAQRKEILNQGYEIARLRDAIEDTKCSNMQLKAGISAQLRPERILSGLQEYAMEFVRPSEYRRFDVPEDVDLAKFALK